jgi:hypothetical protein
MGIPVGGLLLSPYGYINPLSVKSTVHYYRARQLGALSRRYAKRVAEGDYYVYCSIPLVIG